MTDMTTPAMAAAQAEVLSVKNQLLQKTVAELINSNIDLNAGIEILKRAIVEKDTGLANNAKEIERLNRVVKAMEAEILTQAQVINDLQTETTPCDMPQDDMPQDALPLPELKYVGPCQG